MERCDGKNEMGEKNIYISVILTFMHPPKKLCSLQNFPLKVTFYFLFLDFFFNKSTIYYNKTLFRMCI